MKNHIRLAFSGAMLYAAAHLPTAQALDGATQSNPSATAPSSGGGRASGGMHNGMGELKSNQARQYNAPQGEGHGIGSVAGNEAGSAQSPATQSGVPGQMTQPAPVNGPDKLAMRALAQAHLYETKLAGLATAVSGSPVVRGYATKMLEQHLAALDTLRGIAEQKRVILPGGVESGQAAVLHALAMKSGTDFDAAYLNEAGSALQQKELSYIEGVAKSAQLDALRNYAVQQATLTKRNLVLSQQMAGSPQMAANAVAASRTAGQSVSPTAPADTASNRSVGNGGTAGAGSISASAPR